MGYDSFDGGSHSPHHWVVIGHQQIAEWEIVDPSTQAGAMARGNFVLPKRLADKFYVVRACQLCPEVWWQEYDPGEALV